VAGSAIFEPYTRHSLERLNAAYVNFHGEGTALTIVRLKQPRANMRKYLFNLAGNITLVERPNLDEVRGRRGVVRPASAAAAAAQPLLDRSTVPLETDVESLAHTDAPSFSQLVTKWPLRDVKVSTFWDVSAGGVKFDGSPSWHAARQPGGQGLHSTGRLVYRHLPGIFFPDRPIVRSGNGSKEYCLARACIIAIQTFSKRATNAALDAIVGALRNPFALDIILGMVTVAALSLFRSKKVRLVEGDHVVCEQNGNRPSPCQNS
jgi:hypothetical protein